MVFNHYSKSFLILLTKKDARKKDDILENLLIDTFTCYSWPLSDPRAPIYPQTSSSVFLYCRILKLKCMHFSIDRYLGEARLAMSVPTCLEDPNLQQCKLLLPQQYICMRLPWTKVLKRIFFFYTNSSTYTSEGSESETRTESQMLKT